MTIICHNLPTKKFKRLRLIMIVNIYFTWLVKFLCQREGQNESLPYCLVVVSYTSVDAYLWSAHNLWSASGSYLSHLFHMRIKFISLASWQCQLIVIKKLFQGEKSWRFEKIIKMFKIMEKQFMTFLPLHQPPIKYILKPMQMPHTALAVMVLAL